MRESLVSQEQLRLLPERIKFAQESGATDELKEIFGKLNQNIGFEFLKVLIVGGDRSFPAVLAIKQILYNVYRIRDIDACNPSTASRTLKLFPASTGIMIGKPLYDIVIAISYSGIKADIKEIHELCREKRLNFMVVTRATREELKGIYLEDEIVSYHNELDNTGKEIGMTSMAATLSPVVIFDDLKSVENDNKSFFKEAEEIISKLDLKEIIKSIKKTPIINVFYDMEKSPVAYDIESKFTVSSIANVMLHEKNSFSYGRYVSLGNLKSGLNIYLKRKSEVETKYDIEQRKFIEKISLEKSIPILNIENTFIDPVDWNIVAMFEIPYLIFRIGKELNIDISNPAEPFKEDTQALYNYERNS
jgi:hypothetical protein